MRAVRTCSRTVSGHANKPWPCHLISCSYINYPRLSLTMRGQFDYHLYCPWTNVGALPLHCCTSMCHVGHYAPLPSSPLKSRGIIPLPMVGVLAQIFDSCLKTHSSDMLFLYHGHRYCSITDHDHFQGIITGFFVVAAGRRTTKCKVSPKCKLFLVQWNCYVEYVHFRRWTLRMYS